MLDLSPETESRLSEYAATEGINPDEAINRLLRSVTPKPPLENRLPQTQGTDDEKRAAVLAYINAPVEKIARLHAVSIARVEARLAAAENATPEEISEAEAEWQAHKAAMNANRRVTGERAVYAEPAHP